MKRSLCLWFPNWPIQNLLAKQPNLADRFLLLTETVRGREFVRFCCEKSWSVGVRTNMPVSEARSYCPTTPGVLARPLAQETYRQGLEQLAIWCERYSPCVGLEEEDPPQCLLMDVTGLGPLFSGEQTLAEAMVQDLTAQGFRVRVAISDTTGMAWAAARFLTDPDPAVVLPVGKRDSLLPLPVEGLRLQPAHAERLRKLGLKTIGQVLELDRSALKVRFKTELLRCLEHFTGEQRELITPCRPLPGFRVRQQLELGITDFLAVQQLGQSLLRQLTDQLQARHLGASFLECRLTTEDKTQQTIAIRLREASSEPRHLEELLRLKWEGVQLHSPLVEMELEAQETAPLRWIEMRLFAEDSRQQARQLSALLNRLVNRLGEDAVLQAVPGHDPIPERAVEFRPVTNISILKSTGSERRLLPLDRPLCLLPRPQLIDVISILPEGPPSVVMFEGGRFPVVMCFGPERIESGWWRGASIRRDYYHIAIETGARFWVFRQLTDHRWFLHGKMF